MRIAIFVLAAGILAVAPANADMTPPRNVAWECGRITHVGVTGTGGPGSAQTEIVLQGRDGGTRDYVILSDVADGAVAGMTALVARAVGRPDTVAISHAPRSSRANSIEIGASGAPCWQVEAKGRDAYQAAYDAQPRPEPVKTIRKHARLQHLRPHH